MASSTGEVVGIKGSGYLRHAAWLALLWGVAAHAAGTANSGIYRFAPAPAWVEPAQPQTEAPSPPGALNEGAWFLLYDRQIDITAAVSAVLGDANGQDVAQGGPSTSIVRLSVAHRQTIGNLGGEFLEYTDPQRIDLADWTFNNPGQGLIQTVEGLNGPVTIGADVTGLPSGKKPDYVLRIGGHEFHSQVPAVRLTPAQMLQAAGLPLASTTDRTIQLTFDVRSAGQVLASAHQPLVFGPTDGTYSEALAPVVPAVAYPLALATQRFFERRCRVIRRAFGSPKISRTVGWGRNPAKAYASHNRRYLRLAGIRSSCQLLKAL